LAKRAAVADGLAAAQVAAAADAVKTQQRYTPAVRPLHPISRRSALPLLALALACSSKGDDPAVASATVTASAAAPGPAPASDEGDPREPTLATQVSALLQEKHVTGRALDDALSREAFDEYLRELDGGKLFLLKADVDELTAHATELDDEMRRGELTTAHAGAKRLRERRAVVAKVVAAWLEAPFDFTVAEEVETDPKKTDYAATDDELKERWRRMLKLQVLERVEGMEAAAKARAEKPPDEDAPPVEEPPKTFEEREKKARGEIATSYAARFKRWEDGDPLDPATRMLNAVAAVYDPHTTYLAPADKESFDIEMSGSLEGIGAALTEKDHFIQVRELVPGGASWREGRLAPGDLIVAVAQAGEAAIDVTDMPIDKVVKMIRGKKGTVVTLTVRKPDGRMEVISITRDVVVIEAAYARGAILDLGPPEPVGYVYLPSFYGNTREDPGLTGERNATDDVRALLGVFERRGVDSVVLDLRSNGGGLLSHARDISGLFIERGPVVQAREGNEKIEVLEDRDPTVAFHGEVVVLVDRFSASASEILAAALQDYRRALIVGTGPTHGKGTVQVLVDLDRLREGPGAPLGVLKITTQQYFRINGESTQSRGVTPDVVLADPAGHLESGERFLPHALPWTSVAALSYQAAPRGWDPAELAAASKKRSAAEPIFVKIEARAQSLKERRGRTVVPLERGAYAKWRGGNDVADLDEELEKGAARLAVEEVSYGEKGAGDDDPRVKKQLSRWRSQLEHDPWLAEALRVVEDMRRSRAAR
jgi:carboxyl-terminal processing protease